MGEGLADRVNRYLDRFTGGNARPASFDVSRTYPSLLALERGFPVIRAELDGVLPHAASIPRYHKIDRNQDYISAQTDPERAWRTYMLYSVGEVNDVYARQCPRTAALLAGIPNLVNAFFSILDPGKSIPAHCGPYQGVLRYHLGLLVPQQDPPRIRVRDEIHQWREGQGFLFDDSLEHEVTNHSASMRVVLAVDVLRPLPLVAHWINWFTVRKVGRSELAREVNKSIRDAARRMPG